MATVHAANDPPRTGADGTRLTKFEAVMRDVFSPPAPACLIPRYRRLPPSLSDEGRRELVQNAQRYWDTRGLFPSDVSMESSPWPFDPRTSLPQCGHVRGQSQTGPRTSKKDPGVGDVLDSNRATRKELQLANLIRCVLALLPDHVTHQHVIANNDGKAHASKTFRIVDFAGGTGHLAVPLALLLPACEVVCVDLKEWSLDLLHRRVDGREDTRGTCAHEKSRPHQVQTRRKSTTLPNLATYHGSIQNYPDAFDLGVSLHACGEASDWVLRKCVKSRASWVVCSCCCGKLRKEASDPYVYQSTGGNEKEIEYPQSAAFASLGRGAAPAMPVSADSVDRPRSLTADMFDEIARAADYHARPGAARAPRHACRRTAKSLVEWDRLLFTRECMARADERDGRPPSHDVVLTRMVPWEASPKNDILVGWHSASYNPYRADLAATSVLPGDATCEADFRVALRQLFGKDFGDGSCGDTKATREENGADDDRDDWTAREEATIAAQIEAFVAAPHTEGEVLRFPRGMGRRRRKLIHGIAEKMRLRHWGEGKKDSEKIVVVARGRRAR